MTNYLLRVVLVHFAAMYVYGEDEYLKSVRLKSLGFKIQYLESRLSDARCAKHIQVTGNFVGKRSVTGSITIDIQLRVQNKLLEHLVEAYTKCLTERKNIIPSTVNIGRNKYTSLAPKTNTVRATIQSPSTLPHVIQTGDTRENKTSSTVTSGLSDVCFKRISRVQTPRILFVLREGSAVLLQDNTKQTGTGYVIEKNNAHAVPSLMSLSLTPQPTPGPPPGTVSYDLPFDCHFASAIVSDGYLMCVKVDSADIYKYSFQNKSVVATGRVTGAEYRDSDRAGYMGFGEFTTIDLAQDEVGMWAIHVNLDSNGKIVLSRLDPENLSIKQTFKTDITMRRVGHGIVRCGRLYTTNHYTGQPISFTRVFDTRTARTDNVSIPVDDLTGAGNSLVFLDYNPMTQSLYGFRSIKTDQQLVIYSLD